MREREFAERDEVEELKREDREAVVRQGEGGEVLKEGEGRRDGGEAVVVQLVAGGATSSGSQFFFARETGGAYIQELELFEASQFFSDHFKLVVAEVERLEDFLLVPRHCALSLGFLRSRGRVVVVIVVDSDAKVELFLGAIVERSSPRWVERRRVMNERRVDFARDCSQAARGEVEQAYRNGSGWVSFSLPVARYIAG